MLMEDTLSFLYHKRRQPNTIAKLQAERAVKNPTDISKWVLTTQEDKKEAKRVHDAHDATDSNESQDKEKDSINPSSRDSDGTSNADSVDMEEDTAEAASIQDEEDKEMEEASADMVQKECIMTPSKPTYLDAVLQEKFNSFHLLGDHREAIMMKERINISDDASQDIFQRTGSKDRYLQCISMQYGSADEVRTKIMVVQEVINSVMILIEGIEGSATPVKLTKWNTSNPTASLCSQIGKGAKTTMEYIDEFKYRSGNAQNVPGRSNYIQFQLSFAHDIDFDNFLEEVNVQLPELHKNKQGVQSIL